MINSKIAGVFLSWVLILGIFLTIAPAQLFAHHNHQHKICAETGDHFDASKPDCSFCDFIVPVYITTAASTMVTAVVQESRSIFQFTQQAFCFDTPHFFLRGPPSDSIIS